MAISFNKVSKKNVTQPEPASGAKQGIGSLTTRLMDRFGKQVKPKEVMFFTSQLSLMLEIDTPLSLALKSVAAEIKNPTFKVIILEMQTRIEEGRQLSEAMGEHPKVFSHQTVSMIKAGETGGFLKRILDRVVEMQEKRQIITSQLRSALTYPAVLLFFGLIVVVFVLVGVLPKFTAFFEGKEHILPLTTRFLMMTSASLRHFWWVYILVITGLVVLVTIFKNSPQGKRMIDKFFISGPLISGLANKIYTCEMLRTLGYLMESHVPLLEAMEVTRPTIWNQYYQRFVERIRVSIEQGGRFSQPFATYPYIPETVKQMVTIGEEAGRLPDVLMRLVRYYDMEIEQELKQVAAMIEPVALIVMGGLVGVIVSSIILPLFRLSQALR
ncbi:MAG: type II secretion system F family protein [Desulfobacterales bacterium]|nr:type II secretion system F family protein [Desulfobacterales bacterium]MDX2512252.1 type II secretion system F family protein [Desulfobacterales bacterium]